MRLGPASRTVALGASILLGSGCAQNDDPTGARDLFTKVTSGEGFRVWRRAPSFPNRRPSFTAHLDEVEIFVNPTLAAALEGRTPLTQWPVGSIVVKEGYRNGDDTRQLVAIMEKRINGWYWAEYSGEGDPRYSGQPSICLDCHDNRKTYSDWIYAFEFPR